MWFQTQNQPQRRSLSVSHVTHIVWLKTQLLLALPFFLFYCLFPSLFSSPYWKRWMKSGDETRIEHTGKTERIVFVAENGLRSGIIFMVGTCPRSPSRCVLLTHWLRLYCAHVTCSSWLCHCTGVYAGTAQPGAAFHHFNSKYIIFRHQKVLAC